MIVQFKFGWGTKLTQEQVDALNKMIDPEVKIDEGGKIDLYYQSHQGPLESVLAIIGGEQSIELEGMGRPSLVAQLVDKLETLERKLDDKMQGVEALRMYNERCQVAVPSNDLMEITEVLVEENFCTEALNDMLVEGWRIIAACPQPDQRRPDYVLGKRAA